MAKPVCSTNCKITLRRAATYKKIYNLQKLRQAHQALSTIYILKRILRYTIYRKVLCEHTILQRCKLQPLMSQASRLRLLARLR